MSRSRYEPVPQHDETINLESLQNNATYNYNSGLPNSVPSTAAPSYTSSHHAPSVRSIPNSPPPSFHTLSSPGTPRPSIRGGDIPMSLRSEVSAGDFGDGRELWGVAPSTVGATTDVCAASEALATIATLKARVERLEESIGRLLLEKETATEVVYKGGNCCMTFTDAAPALEQGLSAAGGNCCVTFKSSKMFDRARERERRNLMAAVGVGLFIFSSIMLMVVLTKKGDVDLSKGTFEETKRWIVS